MFRGDYFYCRLECCVVIIVIIENIDFREFEWFIFVYFTSKTLQFIPVT